MIYIEAVKQEWIDVLKTIQQVYPTAVIAGGCLRDTIYGKEIKDIDFFIPYAPKGQCLSQTLEKLQELLDLDHELINLSDDADSEDYKAWQEEDRKVISVMAFRIDGVEHQLVFLEPDEKMIDKFDLSFCQILFDGETLETTQMFRDTFNTKVVTLGEGRQINSRIASRIKRFARKFPELTFPQLPEKDDEDDFHGL